MKTNPALEILISTMNRKDLSFLEAMFPVLDLEQYQLLIINQTKLDKELVSHDKRIRVINSKEFGLSKSRNLAIENSIGDILVIADDDIEYLPGFEQIILKAYETYPEASLISFQFLDEHKKFTKFYPKNGGYIKSTKQFLTSFEMTFKSEVFRKYKICFDERFGIGATFPCSEEQVLRHQILKKGLGVAYVAEPICIHNGLTSGLKLSAASILEATTAYKFIQYNNLVYLWLVKYVFFLFRHTHISFFGQIRAYQMGVKAISKLKRLRNED
ncbi:glycosyltransferase family 2 protein [Psychroflexus salinarum]|uniref:Glycosyltransferase family 2 protein n=1 Tax=Psychroflexus salinarum TaxID=546024 RepID=A0ABW3GMW1_9FLAO